jgi:hypothetical protein
MHGKFVCATCLVVWPCRAKHAEIAAAAQDDKS